MCENSLLKKAIQNVQIPQAVTVTQYELEQLVFYGKAKILGLEGGIAFKGLHLAIDGDRDFFAEYHQNGTWELREFFPGG